MRNRALSNGGGRNASPPTKTSDNYLSVGWQSSTNYRESPLARSEAPKQTQSDSGYPASVDSTESSLSAESGDTMPRDDIIEKETVISITLEDKSELLTVTTNHDSLTNGMPSESTEDEETKTLVSKDDTASPISDNHLYHISNCSAVTSL